MAESFDFAGLKTLDALTEVYGRWLRANSRPALSADELYYELLGHDPEPRNELLWLAGFIKKWEDIAYPDEKMPWDSMWDRTTADPDYGIEMEEELDA
jgi:hypothetical protein